MSFSSGHNDVGDVYPIPAGGPRENTDVVPTSAGITGQMLTRYVDNAVGLQTFLIYVLLLCWAAYLHHYV